MRVLELHNKLKFPKLIILIFHEPISYLLLLFRVP